MWRFFLFLFLFFFFGNYCSSLTFYLVQECIDLYRIWSSFNTIIEGNCIIFKCCSVKMSGLRASSMVKSACCSNMRFLFWSSSTYVKSQVWSCVLATGHWEKQRWELTGYQPKQNTSSRSSEWLSQGNKVDSVKVRHLTSSFGTWVRALIQTCSHISIYRETK